MVTGGRPFEADNFGDIVVKHVTSPIPKPSEWPGAPYEIPVELEQLIVACLGKQPSDRIGSMSEVELSLRAMHEASLFDDAATTALRGVGAPVIPVAAPAVARDVDFDLGPEPSRSGWKLAGLAAIAVVGVGLLLWSRAGDEPAPPTQTPISNPQPRPAVSAPVDASPPAPVTTKTGPALPTVERTKPTSRVTNKPRKPRRYKKRRKRRPSKKRRKDRKLIDKNAVIDPFDD